MTVYLSAAWLPSENQYLAFIKLTPLGTSETAFASNIMSFQTGTSPDLSCSRATRSRFVETASATSNDTTSSAVGDVGLCLFKVSISDSTLTQAEVCDTTVSPTSYVDSAKTSGTVIALSYFDTANNYALMVSLVEFSTIIGSPTFRSSYVLDESVSQIDFGSAFGFDPTPTLRVLANNRLACAVPEPFQLRQAQHQGSVVFVRPSVRTNTNFTV